MHGLLIFYKKFKLDICNLDKDQPFINPTSFGIVLKIMKYTSIPMHTEECAIMLKKIKS